MTVESQPAHGGVLSCGVLLLLLVGLCRVSGAAEIAPFRLTGLGGAIELAYDLSQQSTDRAGVSTSDRRLHRFEEVLEVDTQSYIYHPNLLKLDAGFGLNFTQDRSQSGSGSQGVDGQLINYDLRASILEKKPYPLVVFANRDSFTSYPTLGERLAQTRTGYGFNLRLQEPFVPATMSFDVQRDEQQGGSASQIVDATQDNVSVVARKNYSNTDYVDGAYRWSRQASASGAIGDAASPANPITRKLSVNNVLDIGSGNTFGERDQFVLTNSASYNTERGSKSVNGFSISPNLRWKYSDDLSAYANYSFDERDQVEVASSNRAAAAGLNLVFNKDLTGSGNLNWNDNRTTGSQLRSIGGEGQLGYEKSFGPVTLRLQADVDYERQDQVSTEPIASVIGEPITLVNFVPVALSTPYVDTGTVVVSNALRTQVYTEGIDYDLVTVGSTTTIERVVTGNIQDGEEVLVDYDYETGGTYGSENLGYGITADVGFLKYYRAFASYTKQEVSLISGDPSLPLNPSSTVSYGVSISNYPLPMRARANLRLDFRHQREEVSPTDNANLQIDVSAPFGRRTQVVASFHKSIVDNLNSNEDTDLVSYHVAVRSRPMRAVGVNAEIRNQLDTGGSEVREDWTGSVTVDWRLYRLQISATADYALEKQGDVEQNGFNFSLTARRDF